MARCQLRRARPEGVGISLQRIEFITETVVMLFGILLMLSIRYLYLGGPVQDVFLRPSFRGMMAGEGGIGLFCPVFEEKSGRWASPPFPEVLGPPPVERLPLPSGSGFDRWNAYGKGTSGGSPLFRERWKTASGRSGAPRSFCDPPCHSCAGRIAEEGLSLAAPRSAWARKRRSD